MVKSAANEFLEQLTPYIPYVVLGLAVLAYTLNVRVNLAAKKGG